MAITYFDEDTFFDAAEVFINSEGFDNKLCEIVLKSFAVLGSGHKTNDDFVKVIGAGFNVDDENIHVGINLLFKPFEDDFDEIIYGERIDDDYDKERFEKFVECEVSKISDSLNNIVWAAVYNYPVLRVVNGGADQIPLGDYSEFNVVVDVYSEIDYSNI